MKSETTIKEIVESLSVKLKSQLTRLKEIGCNDSYINIVETITENPNQSLFTFEVDIDKFPGDEVCSINTEMQANGVVANSLFLHGE